MQDCSRDASSASPKKPDRNRPGIPYPPHHPARPVPRETPRTIHGRRQFFELVCVAGLGAIGASGSAGRDARRRARHRYRRSSASPGRLRRRGRRLPSRRARPRRGILRLRDAPDRVQRTLGRPARDRRRLVGRPTSLPRPRTRLGARRRQDGYVRQRYPGERRVIDDPDGATEYTATNAGRGYADGRSDSSRFAVRGAPIRARKRRFEVRNSLWIVRV